MMKPNLAALVGIPVLVVALTAVAARADDRYAGPDKPDVTADTEVISTSPADCKKAVLDVWGADDDQAKSFAKQLCGLRKKHVAARTRLRAALAALVTKYKGQTNHDHDQRLQSTIDSINQVVTSCRAALDSQEYCHNVQCDLQPEDDAIYCETMAAELAERI